MCVVTRLHGYTRARMGKKLPPKQSYKSKPFMLRIFFYTRAVVFGVTV